MIILIFAVLFCGKLLLSAGADVDLADNSGWTALMRTARTGCLEVAGVRSMEIFSYNCDTICYSESPLFRILSLCFNIYQAVVVPF